MENLKDEKIRKQFFPKFFASLWLFITFLNIPYFLAAANLNPSQFILLDTLFLDIHLGIHHGLIGYIALSIGILGMYYSDQLKQSNVRNYLFLISVFFIVKGAYLSVEDLVGEQLLHYGVERNYIWDWKAPEVEVFSMIGFLPIIWMKNHLKLLIWITPVFVISTLVTPFAPITVAYLILILVFEEGYHQKPDNEMENNWKVLKRTTLIVGTSLAAVYLGILIGRIFLITGG